MKLRFSGVFRDEDCAELNPGFSLMDTARASIEYLQAEPTGALRPVGNVLS